MIDADSAGKGLVASYADRAYRRISSPLRSLPDFLIVGGMRCGTTSLTRWLKLHPGVDGSSVREVHYFDKYHDRGVNWYRSHFRFRSSRRLAFEKTPSYMLIPESADRAAALLPDARLVALVREPAQRAWSHYRWRIGKGNEDRTFEEAINAELSSPPVAPDAPSADRPMQYVAAGHYAEQLVPWIDAYGSGSLLILDSHLLFESPEPSLHRLFEFLGFERADVSFDWHNQAPQQPPDERIFRLLRQHYREPNRHLADLMGLDPSWLDRDATI